MTPYRVDVRRPDGWHTLTVRATSPEMATSYALRSTHDALEARQAVVDESAAPAPQNDPQTPHRRNNGVSSCDVPGCGVDAYCMGVRNGCALMARGGVVPPGRTYLIGEELPPPKPDMSIAWGITEALIEEAE